MGKLVIGKIPGYNSNIEKPKGPQYKERLLNNLTSVRLTPTGYNINWAGGENAAAGEVRGVYNIGPKEKLNIGSDFSSTVKIGTALENWKRLVKSQSSAFPKFLSNGTTREVDELFILCTNDSTMSEVFSNSFEMSTTEKLANSFAEINVIDKFKKFKKLTTIDSNLGLSMLGATSDVAGGVTKALGNPINGSMLNVLAGKSLGIQTALPEEWISSDYNNTLQLMIKLVSPSGDDKSIQNNIIKPLLFIILAAAPMSVDGINFGYPMLWEVKADGLMDIPLAGISALTITRGGAETQFNKDNQPLNIDVRLTISPLVKGFASAISKSLVEKDYPGDGKKVYDSVMMSSSPELLSRSFNNEEKSDNYHHAIKL